MKIVGVLARRRFVDVASKMLMGAATVVGVIFLLWILWTTLKFGAAGMHWDLFIKDTPPPGTNSFGLRNAFVGSLILLGVALLIGVPIGLMGGTWLAEYGFHSRTADTVRFINDIMLSAPSIEIGLFAYAIMVAPMGHFSALSGSVALAVLMIPIIMRTTDEMLGLVGADIREAAAPVHRAKQPVLFDRFVPPHSQYSGGDFSVRPKPLHQLATNGLGCGLHHGTVCVAAQFGCTVVPWERSGA